MTRASIIFQLNQIILPLVALFGLCGTGHGDILLSLDPLGSTVVDTGAAGPGKVINFFISQDATDALVGTTPAFEIEAGRVTGGSAGQPGDFGFGQWVSSRFTVATDRRFEVSQEAADFLVGVTPVTSPLMQPYFTLELDTSGLAIGDYGIELRPAEFNFASLDGGALRGISSNGSFTYSVTAVPEPLSAISASLFLGTIAYRRRRQTSKVSETKLADRHD